MRTERTLRILVSGVATAALLSCSDSPTEPPRRSDGAISPAAAKRAAPGSAQTRLADLLHAINDQLAAAGSPYRVSEVATYTIGTGRPPTRILQRGSRWVPGDPRRAVWTTATNPEDVTYMIDTSDPSDELSAAMADPALDAAFQSWSDVPGSYLDFEEIEDNGGNHDLLDVFPAETFEDLVDLCADPNSILLLLDPAWDGPATDVIVGGWLDRGYFDCLSPADDPGDAGGELIIGVTWTLIWTSGGVPTDINNDGYVDTQFKEVYFNDFWDWATSGTEFLDFSSGVDLQTIAVHEFGHVAELGHFGDIIAGILNTRSPRAFAGFLERGQIFSPVAIMNPGYLGGEFRLLQPIDEAGYSTLFAHGAGRQQ